MKEEIYDAVLNEMLEELRQVNRALKEQRIIIKEMNERVEGFEQKLRDQQVIVQPPDLGVLENSIQLQSERLGEERKRGMEAIVEQMGLGLQQVADAVERQPKPIHRHVRISFFPEYHEGSYKYFIRWLFGGTILALSVLGLFVLGRQYLNERSRMADAAAVARAATPAESYNRAGFNRPTIHGLTAKEARRKLDSMMNVQKMRRQADTLQNTTIQHLPDRFP